MHSHSKDVLCAVTCVNPVLFDLEPGGRVALAAPSEGNDSSRYSVRAVSLHVIIKSQRRAHFPQVTNLLSTASWCSKYSTLLPHHHALLLQTNSLRNFLTNPQTKAKSLIFSKVMWVGKHSLQLKQAQKDLSFLKKKKTTIFAESFYKLMQTSSEIEHNCTWCSSEAGLFYFAVVFPPQERCLMLLTHFDVLFTCFQDIPSLKPQIRQNLATCQK